MRYPAMLASVCVPMMTLAASPAVHAAGAPTTINGYTIGVFAHAPPGASQPDSLEVVDRSIWVGYGGAGKPDGSGGATSQIVEYSSSGHLIRNLTVVGHNDGLKLDPRTHKLWALQNEDGNANLVLITPGSGAMSKPYTFSAATHGGGYDDVAFIGAAAYVSASNPSTDHGAKNPGPAIIRAALQRNQTVLVTSEMPGTPSAINVVTGKTTQLNLTDPDSLTVTPGGDLLLDSQGDGELLWMRPGSTAIHVLPLTDNVQVDDTVFVTSPAGYLLVSDTDDETVYKITARRWTKGVAYSASTGVDATTKPLVPAVPAYVGRLDFKTGALVPIATQLASPHGMVFVPTGR